MMKKILYKLRKDEFHSDECGYYISYGINVFEDNKLIKSIKDVSLNRKPLLELVNMCNNGELSLLHLDDVVYDFISN